MPRGLCFGLPPLNWTYDKTSGTGTLSQGSKNWTMHGQKDNDPMPVKIWYSAQNGAIVLKDSCDSGAGISNLKTVTVSAESGKTWTVPALLLTRDECDLEGQRGYR